LGNKLQFWDLHFWSVEFH